MASAFALIPAMLLLNEQDPSSRGRRQGFRADKAGTEGGNRDIVLSRRGGGGRAGRVDGDTPCSDASVAGSTGGM